MVHFLKNHNFPYLSTFNYNYKIAIKYKKYTGTEFNYGSKRKPRFL